MAKAESRQFKTFYCSICKEENYRLQKNVKNTTEKLELMKYCPKCQKHTLHKEKK